MFCKGEGSIISLFYSRVVRMRSWEPPHWRVHFDKSHPDFCSMSVLHTSNSVPDRIVTAHPKIILLGTILVVLCTPERSKPGMALNKTNQKKGCPNLCPADTLRFSIQTGIDRMVIAPDFLSSREISTSLCKSMTNDQCSVSIPRPNGLVGLYLRCSAENNGIKI